MVANCSSVETCTQDTNGVVECDLIPLEECLPVIWPMPSDTSSDTPRALKTTDLTPVEARAQDPTFVTQCSLTGLKDRLPLIWPIPPDTPPSPKKNYRSYYVYLGWDDLLDPTVWEYLSDFDLILRLVDLCPGTNAFRSDFHLSPIYTADPLRKPKSGVNCGVLP